MKSAEFHAMKSARFHEIRRIPKWAKDPWSYFYQVEDCHIVYFCVTVKRCTQVVKLLTFISQMCTFYTDTCLYTSNGNVNIFQLQSNYIHVRPHFFLFIGLHFISRNFKVQQQGKNKNLTFVKTCMMVLFSSVQIIYVSEMLHFM